MNRLCWQLVNLVSRMLEPNDRNAVHGDFAESGDTGVEVLRGVLGLVARQQLVLWMYWRPWMALLGIVLPLGLLLGVFSRALAIYAFSYAHNWNSGFLEPLYRLHLAHDIAWFVLRCTTLICWSWTAGFVVGSLSRRAVWVNGGLFGLVLSVGIITRTGVPFNAAAFPQFYGVVLPLVPAVLVLLPALRGMRKGFQIMVLPLRRTILWSAAIATLMGVAAGTGGVGGLVFGLSIPLSLIPPDREFSFLVLRLLALFSLLAVMWPAAYMVAAASWKHWRVGSTHTAHRPLS